MANDLNINVNIEGKAAQELKKLSQSVKDIEVDVRKAGFSFERSFETLTGVLGAGVIKDGFQSITNAAKQLFDTLVLSGVKAAEAQEDAVNKLNVALAASGRYSKETSKDLQEYASALQATTKFGDEAIIETEALIQSLGQLDQKGLKQATQASLDLSAALGIDLHSATLLVGKAAAGEVSTFSRYGLIIKKGKDEATTFANALDAINSRFGGAAAAQVNTFSGATQQLANSFGDFTEEIGNTIIQNQTFIQLTKELNKIFHEFGQIVIENQDAIKIIVSQGVLLLIDSLAVLASVLDPVTKAFRIAFQVIKEGFDSLVAVSTAAVAVLHGDFTTALKVMSDAGKETTEDLKKSIFDPTLFGTINDGLARLKGAAEQGFNAVKEGASTSVEPINASAEALKKLSPELKKLGEEGETLFKQLSGAQRTEELKNNLDAQHEVLNEALDQELITQQEFLEAEALLQEQRDQAEIDRLIKKNDELIKAGALKNDEEIKNNQEYIKQKIKDNQNLAKNEDKIREQSILLEQQKNAQLLDASKQFFGNLSSLSRSSNKTLGAIGQIAASTRAVINTAEGVTKALSAYPPPINFALAASVAAAGAVEIATINAAKFARGIDSVPAGFNNDSFPALLTSGERVVPAETNKDLTSFLRQNEGTNKLLAAIDSKLSQLQPNVSVQIGEDIITDSIRSAMKSGRSFA